MSSIEPIHVIGGGLAGSEAAFQAAEMGVPVILHEMRPHVATFAHQTDGLAELVCSNSFRSDDDEQNAVGLLHWEMRAGERPHHGHRRRPCRPRRRRARHRPRALQRRRHRPPRSPPAHQDRTRRDRRPPPRRLVERHHRHRPAHLARARRSHPRPHRRIRARLLRRHRPHHPRREHRPLEGLVPVALRQGRHRGGPHRLPQLPDGPRPVRGLHRRAPRRPQDRIQGLGARHPLFRGLPAHRGHGRARPRDPALRPAQARRPHQPARARRSSPTPSSSSAATTRSARSSTSSASRPR